MACSSQSVQILPGVVRHRFVRLLELYNHRETLKDEILLELAIIRPQSLWYAFACSKSTKHRLLVSAVVKGSTGSRAI